MIKRLFVLLAFTAPVGLGTLSASAQLPGGPDGPRPDKPKATPTPAESAPSAPAHETRPAAPPQPNTGGAAAPAASAPAPAATAQGRPPIAKEWLLVRPVTLSSHKGSYNATSWLPRIEFTANVDRPSGASYYAEFMQPGGAPWVKLDCRLGGVEWECKVPDESDQKSVTAVGVFPFAVKMKNPLDGTDKTLFTGKAKVEKAPQLAPELKKPAQVSYFVNYDWALPIGYVFDEGEWPTVAFMVRGTNSSGLQLHVFYKGQEVGTKQGPFDCSTTEQNPQPTNGTHDSFPQGGTWERVSCGLKGLSWTGEHEGFHFLDKNPGEHEVKVLWKSELVRTMKFTVGPDGKIVDNGVARGNGIIGLDPVNGRDTKRFVIPVTVLGTQDGKWDRNAWKTDAFFGNPLAGFTVP